MLAEATYAEPEAQLMANAITIQAVERKILNGTSGMLRFTILRKISCERIVLKCISSTFFAKTE